MNNTCEWPKDMNRWSYWILNKNLIIRILITFKKHIVMWKSVSNNQLLVAISKIADLIGRLSGVFKMLMTSYNYNM